MAHRRTGFYQRPWRLLNGVSPHSSEASRTRRRSWTRRSRGMPTLTPSFRANGSVAGWCSTVAAGWLRSTLLFLNTIDLRLLATLPGRSNRSKDSAKHWMSVAGEGRCGCFTTNSTAKVWTRGRSRLPLDTQLAASQTFGLIYLLPFPRVRDPAGLLGMHVNAGTPFTSVPRTTPNLRSRCAGCLSFLALILSANFRLSR